MNREVRDRLLAQLKAALIKWAEKQILERVFKGVWFKRWRWLFVLVPLAGGCAPDAMAQGFVADVDYQIQRQYKGPFLRHEVFTSAAELAAYVDGGEAARAYAGQVVVLIEGDNEPVTYTLGRNGTGLVAHRTGGAPDVWSVYPAVTDVDLDGFHLIGAADVLTAGGASLEAAALLAGGAVQTNHTGDVALGGDLAVAGTATAAKVVAGGVYDASGRSIAGIAVDSAVRYDAGKTWVAAAGTEPEVGSWDDIAWSPRLRMFIAVSGAAVGRSTDGVNWTLQEVPVSSPKAVAWAEGLGLFVMVNDNLIHAVALSADGYNWSLASIPPSGTLRGVTWAQELGLLVAVGATRIATSPDGQVWTTQSVNSLWYDVCWVPELGLAVASSSGLGPRIGISSDGVNWTYPTVPDNYFLGVTWSPELRLLVAVGSKGGTYASVLVSADGATWTTVPAAPKAGWNSVRWSSEARCFVAVAYGGQVMRSTDGVAWALQTVPNAKPWWSLAWSPALRTFVAGGDGGMIVSTVGSDVSVGNLAVEGTISTVGGISASGDVRMGTTTGTNVIAGDTQIGNSERRIEINQKGLAIIDAVTEDVEFAVEQVAGGLWRVDLRGNPLINAEGLSFAGGGRLQSDGTNLFFVPVIANVTNRITNNNP